MHFTQLLIRNLTRRPFRTTLTLVALASGIATVVALTGIANGFKNSFATIYSSRGVDIVISRQGSADRLSTSVDAALVPTIAKLEAIEQADGVLLDSLSLESHQVFGIPTMGLLPDRWIMQSYSIVQGKSLNPSDSHHLLLGKHLAERLKLAVGDSLTFFDESFEVVGIFTSQSVWENGSIILPLEVMQHLIDRPGQLTYINVALKDAMRSPSGLSNALQAIQQVDAKLLPLATDEFVTTDTRMQLASAMAWLTSAIALIMGGIGILNTMMTSVLERTQEIGILRALGWPRGKVLRMILGEASLLGIVASLLGFAVAYGLTYGLSRSDAAKGLIDPQVDGLLLVQAVGLGIGIGLCGALLPAWRAICFLPTEAFRQN